MPESLTQLLLWWWSALEHCCFAAEIMTMRRQQLQQFCMALFSLTLTSQVLLELLFAAAAAVLAGLLSAPTKGCTVTEPRLGA